MIAEPTPGTLQERAVRKPLVLLVDDDARTARRLGAMLQEDGFAVEVMGDSVEALARLGRLPAPDVLVTDLLMPRVTGIALMKRAREVAGQMAIIFVTGHPELMTAAATAGQPAPVVFTKPVSYPELNDAITRAARETH